MSSLVGHILGAAAAHRSLQTLTPDDAPRGAGALLLVGALAMAPDLDILWGWTLGDATLFHRGVSHSILFAAMLALAGSLIWYRTLGAFKACRSLVVLFAVCLVHPALDWLMGCGPGIPWLAPFSWQGSVAPRQFVPTAYYTRSFSDLPALLADPRAVIGTLLELWIFLPLFLASTPRRRALSRVVLLVVAAAGCAVTYLRYNG